MLTTDLRIIEDTLRAAREWDAKGDPVWARRNYASALLGFLRMSLGECSDAGKACKLLRRYGVPELLDVFLDRHVAALEPVRSGRLPAAALGDNYELLALAHLAVLLDRLPAAEDLTRYATEPQVIEISTNFWAEYGRALLSLHRRQPYAPDPPARLTGLEKYWLAYLDLFADLTQGRDPSGSLEKVDESFRKRNADKRLRNDAHRIDGSGLAPVRWDFRRAGILHVAGSAR